MKITKRQIMEAIAGVNEGYNSMSRAGKALAQRAKRQFAKDYPEVKVGIDARQGWVTVDGKKAVNMSQASGGPMGIDDVIDKMKQTYLGYPVQESKTMKITKRQLKRIIKEEKARLAEYDGNPAADGMRAARHEGRPDYARIAMEIDRAAQIIEQAWDDAEASLVMSDHKSLADNMEKLANDAFNLGVTFDTLAEG